MSSHPAQTNVINNNNKIFDNLINQNSSANLKITNTASYVRSGAFQNFTNVYEVSLPDCTSIGESAFDGCTNLLSVSFPNVSSIYSFPENVENICIGVTTIPSEYYSGNVILRNISFPECEAIGYGAFQSCSLYNTSFPKCKTIANIAFRYCGGGFDAIFPSCTYIGPLAFQSCNVGIASFPLFSSSITGNTFYYCQLLSTAYFPLVQNIGISAFGSCRILKSANFDSVKIVGSSAFEQCSQIKILSFPSCTNIYEYAFFSCTNLEKLYLLGSSVVTLAHSNAFLATRITSNVSHGTIFVTSSLFSAYMSANNWSLLSKYLKSSRG